MARVRPVGSADALVSRATLDGMPEDRLTLQTRFNEDALLYHRVADGTQTMVGWICYLSSSMATMSRSTFSRGDAACVAHDDR